MLLELKRPAHIGAGVGVGVSDVDGVVLRFSVRQPRKPVMHNVKSLLVCQPVNSDELIDNQNKMVYNYEFYLHKTGYCIVTSYLSKKFRVIAEKLIQ